MVLTLFQLGEAQHSLVKVELLKVAVENLVIRSNYCENVGNAAICPSDYENAFIEYNVANGCNSGPNGNVPIWWEHGQKTICQYNEVFGSGASDDKEDSQAFDADVYADLNYVQYNYSYYWYYGFYNFNNFSYMFNVARKN